MKVDDPLILTLEILPSLECEIIVEGVGGGGGVVCIVGVSEICGDFFKFDATFSWLVKRSISSLIFLVIRAFAALLVLKGLLALNSILVEGNIRSPVAS